MSSEDELERCLEAARELAGRAGKVGLFNESACLITISQPIASWLANISLSEPSFY